MRIRCSVHNQTSTRAMRWLGLLLVCCWAAGAAAQRECGRAGRPWVSLAFSGQGFSPELRRAAAADLSAGLELQGIDVCALGTEGSERPLALIEMRMSGQDRVAVGIDVHDAVTEKRVLRDVDLSSMPPDGHGLTLAVAAEELLRASWAELALHDAPAPALEPPAEVHRTLERSLGSPQVRALGARAAARHHTGGLTLLGAEASLSIWPVELLGCELPAGLASGLPASSEHGVVEASWGGGSLSALLALQPSQRDTRLLAKLGLQVGVLRFEGIADAGARDARLAGVAVTGHLGLGLRQRLFGALQLVFELLVGLPLRALAASDGGRLVVSTDGVQLAGEFGLGVGF